MLFAILAANGLALSLEKCIFTVSELDFLSHRISAAGIAPLWENLQVILDFPKPADCKALQRFLGMINFDRRLFPGTAVLQQHVGQHWQPLGFFSKKALQN
jgi:hypothetical protein